MSCEVFQVTLFETVSLQSLDSEPNLIIGHPQGSQNVLQDLQIRSTRDTGDAGRLHGQAQKTHGSPIGVCEVTLPSWKAKLAAISLKEKSRKCSRKNQGNAH